MNDFKNQSPWGTITNARSDHACTSDGGGNTLYIFGGYNGGHVNQTESKSNRINSKQLK